MAGLQASIRVFGKIGLASFGGPAAQIALMHRELVDARDWLSEEEFLRALSFCMLLPGPEAMQLATYSGWKRHGVLGGLIAGGLFVLPGTFIILCLAALYATLGQVPLFEAVFLGVKATVMAIVIEALIKVAKRALKGRGHWVIAGLSFLAIFALGLPFPLIIATAALWGYWTATDTKTSIPAPRPGHLLPTVALWGSLWVAPILVLWLSGAALLTSIAVFFSKLAVVTFGGAYAVLAYMTQEVVQDHGWVTTAAMMDGLGLAETTPGPLILVTEFIGFLAGHAEGGFVLGLAAALVTLWVTFVPCFLWIFAGAPYLEWLASRPRLSAALAGVTAAVVGVILNLSIWFGVHVLFRDVGTFSVGPFSLIRPDLASLDVLALALTVLAATLLFVLRWPLLVVLAVSALLGLGTGFLGW